MKALQISAYGDPSEVIQIVDVDEPAAPGEKQVLAAVEYAPLNMAELLLMRGMYGVRPELPTGLGPEGVGRVLAVGKAVMNVRVGDRVVLPAGVPAWRERATFDAEGLFALPKEADAQQLSMLKVNPATAGFLLTDFSGVKRGEWIIQNAGNSGVGRNVIAFARDLGIKTVSLVRREELVGELKDAGADVVLVDGPGVAKRVSEATGNAKISIAFDGVAGESTSSLISSLAPGGKLIFYAAVSGQPGQTSPIHVIFKRITVSGFWLGYPEVWTSPRINDFMKQAAGLIAGGKLHVPVDAVYGLADAKKAIKHAEKGGKVLFEPSEG